MTEQKELSTAILEWAATQTDEAVLDPRKGYYPFEVLADAFKKGAEHAEKNFTERVRKQLYDNAKLITVSVGKLLGQLNEESFKPGHLYVRVNIDSAAMLITVEESIYLSENFMDKAYEWISNLQVESYEKGLNLEVGFLNHGVDIDEDALKCDGYEIGLDLIGGKRIY